MTEIACVVEAHDALGECCLWCPSTPPLWWIDIQKPCLQSYDPVTGSTGSIPCPAGTAAAPRCEDPAASCWRWTTACTASIPPAASSTSSFTPSRTSRATATTTAAATAAAGSGSAPWISASAAHPAASTGSAPTARVLRLFDGITVPNSTAFSPDDRTLYFADTPRHVIWAFDFNLHAGDDRERRVFADLTARKGHPDGSCVDAEGFLWNAEYGGHRLTRYAPDGRSTAPSSCR